MAALKSPFHGHPEEETVTDPARWRHGTLGGVFQGRWQLHSIVTAPLEASFPSVFVLLVASPSGRAPKAACSLPCCSLVGGNAVRRGEGGVVTFHSSSRQATRQTLPPGSGAQADTPCKVLSDHLVASSWQKSSDASSALLNLHEGAVISLLHDSPVAHVSKWRCGVPPGDVGCHSTPLVTGRC